MKVNLFDASNQHIAVVTVPDLEPLAITFENKLYVKDKLGGYFETIAVEGTQAEE